MRAGRTVLARTEPLLARHKLTATQFGVLEALLHKGPLTQRELGAKVLTSAGNMTAVVDQLARRGLVARLPNPADRRQVRVTLTPEGRAFIAVLFPAQAEAIARAMAALSPAEQETLGALLRRLGKGEDAVTVPQS